MPGPNTRFERTLETAERDAEVCRLRATGIGFPEIGRRLGMSRQGAHAAHKRALREVVREAADDVRAIELDRLDTLYRTALGVMAKTHPMVQNGRVMRDADGRPVEDSMPRLQAIDRLLRIQERRARLLGLDAPAKTDVRVTDALDEQIQQLAAELGFMAALGDIREADDQI